MPFNRIIKSKAGDLIAKAGDVCVGDVEANARLIAAAPELLEAAMEMAMLLENALRIGAIDKNLIIAESIRSVLPIHRAAIAKATGA